MHKLYFFLLIVVTFYNNSWGNTPLEPYIAGNCHLNSVKNDEYLATKPTSSVNDLSKNSKADKIIIYGRIFDQNCLPVSDATVRIWQNYEHEKLSAKAVTNNIGEFTFLLPENKAHLDIGKIIITHHIFAQAEYKIEWHGLKNLDEHHLKLDNKWLNSGQGFDDYDPKKIYPLTITLKGINQNKRF